MTISEEIFTIFRDKGESSYFGEPVSQLEHALQAAYFAQQEQAPEHLIAAALLHDIGHLLENTPENTADLGIDAMHEEIGNAWLAGRFGPRVCEPVHLHVAAKRYLCATDATYLAKLSPASLQSLHLQGGPMRPEEIRDFERHTYYREALALRHWDDRAKIRGLIAPALLTYRDVIERAHSAPAVE